MRQDHPASDDGELHTLNLLEELRSRCEGLWGKSSDLYFNINDLLRELANPNLPRSSDGPALPYGNVGSHGSTHSVGSSANASVALAHAALDAAIESYPGERLTLRNGVQVIREYVPRG